jgi:hypothetical protein
MRIIFHSLPNWRIIIYITLPAILTTFTNNCEAQKGDNYSKKIKMSSKKTEKEEITRI